MITTPIPVYKSKFTPNVSTHEICFSIGETVKYKLRSGEEIDIVINSDKVYLEHDGVLLYGYDSLFLDDNKMYFAVEEQIINWEGRVY